MGKRSNQTLMCHFETIHGEAAKARQSRRIIKKNSRLIMGKSEKARQAVV
jgi:hypothetical protein